MTQSWKTTAIGTLGGASYLGASIAQDSFSWPDLIISIVLALLGIFAKDFNISRRF